MSAPSLLRLLGAERPWSALGGWPTRVDRIAHDFPELGADNLYVKRDDLSSSVYGGSKVRALEPLLGDVVARGESLVCASGACGSNSLVATTLHAERVGIDVHAVGFAQPPSHSAAANARRVVAHCQRFVMLPHWALVPASLVVARAGALREGRSMTVLPPALMSPVGALGHVSGALELAEQVERGELPVPQSVVIGLGSACTAAGLLVGFWLAPRLGLKRIALPRVVAVRVAPWPVAGTASVLRLARAAAVVVAKLRGRPEDIPTHRELARSLTIDGAELGAGYGLPTARGRAARERFIAAGCSSLDDVYGAKIAAGFLKWVGRRPRETTVLWATHSSVTLDAPTEPRCHVPWLLERFLSHAQEVEETSVLRSPKSWP